MAHNIITVTKQTHICVQLRRTLAEPKIMAVHDRMSMWALQRDIKQQKLNTHLHMKVLVVRARAL